MEDDEPSPRPAQSAEPHEAPSGVSELEGALDFYERFIARGNGWHLSQLLLDDFDSDEAETGGVRKWNQWRLENPHTRPCLRDFSLGGFNLSGIQLQGVNMAGARFESLVLSAASLTAANMNDMQAIKCRFTATRMEGAVMQRCSFRECDFSSAKMRLSIMIGGQFINCNFTNTDLRYCVLLGTNMTGCNLAGARMFAALTDGAVIEESERAKAVWEEKSKPRQYWDRGIYIVASRLPCPPSALLRRRGLDHGDSLKIGPETGSSQGEAQ
jgi:Pentapeptide repeats (8 copies)